ncbi:MAG: (2Fe-2S)-binding protein [Clostridiales bacterium]|nr:(2Fe-2S)-binding protein [Clostridiales bacterium]
MENYTICNCKKVTYADVENVINSESKFENVEKAFEDVQKITKCSTGCGGCHDKIMDTISEIMNK